MKRHFYFVTWVALSGNPHCARYDVQQSKTFARIVNARKLARKLGKQDYSSVLIWRRDIDGTQHPV